MSVAAFITADRELVVGEHQQAPLEPDEVTVDVAYCGLCGSDLHLFFDAPEPAAGHVLGHEFSGTVAAIGSEVTGWEIGDRVVVRPIVPCGECLGCSDVDNGFCLAGLVAGPGLGRQGGLARSVAVPVSTLFRIPDRLGLREAALVEPLAAIVRAVRRAGVTAGDAVVVTGAGPMGLLTVAALKAIGITSILVIEPNAERRAVAGRLGADTATPDTALARATELFSGKVRAVIECSGHPDTAQQALQLLGYQGVLVLVGVASVPSQINTLQVVINEITIIGSTAHGRADFAEAIAYLADGRVDTEALITTVADLDQTDAKIRELASGTSSDVKILIRHHD